MTQIQPKAREVAKRTWICNLLKGSYTPSQGWTPGFVEYGGQRYSRVVLVGSVVSKFVSDDGNYASLIVDDGTETIRLKAFGPDVAKLAGIEVGALVRVFGKVRAWADEIYLMPEIVRVIEDPNWLLVHRLQLGSPADAVRPEESKPQVPAPAAEDVLKSDGMEVQSKILDLIKELDRGLGAHIDAVIARSGLAEDEAKGVLFSLLKAGEIYEPKKGQLKVLA